MSAAAWIESEPLRQPSPAHLEQALARQRELTKPPGSLGALEQIAAHLAAIQHTEYPAADAAHFCLFAADHGITAEGVSAVDSIVTQQMLLNFIQGGAAISVLAKSLGAPLRVVDVGTRWPGALPGPIHDARIAPGTANMRRAPAMSAEQFAAALNCGREAVDLAAAEGVQVWIAGEMGIGNTSAAAALSAALLEKPASALVGPGTGHDPAGLRHKTATIAAALAFHRDDLGNPAALRNPWEAGRRVGGLEIAAMAGSYLRCAQLGIAVVLDGFISAAAALLAERLRPGTRAVMLYGHRSAEPGHDRILAALGGRPLLDLGMRLGEGSGAAAALPLLRLACAIHRDMATFAQAGVHQAGDQAGGDGNGAERQTAPTHNSPNSDNRR
ncbi:nicotinate-nucleotide--dimethylbenzimidazole phosphoribosyltransferase [Halorhodospira abdelmalekii]|uniref:nicotinate-nucleotide--dimethylbenzimidazole phosphoribosyltransferase n=1 Tax=Halorhodospira abdelmalekii TaxID=421629 RepID=UPI0019090280|nr:nicotinate-nucleotide--dimethylbenzimidazole phosphoribosyltransferase [Halorhodospira abdelmalekii]